MDVWIVCRGSRVELDEKIQHTMTTIASNAEQYVTVLKTMADKELRDNILAAYTSSFRNVFELGLVLTVLGALVSLLIRKSVFDRKHVTEHVLEEKRTPSLKDNSSSDESC